VDCKQRGAVRWPIVFVLAPQYLSVGFVVNLCKVKQKDIHQNYGES
jgi:hypothetical protein